MASLHNGNVAGSFWRLSLGGWPQPPTLLAVVFGPELAELPLLPHAASSALPPTESAAPASAELRKKSRRLSGRDPRSRG